MQQLKHRIIGGMAAAAMLVGGLALTSPTGTTQAETGYTDAAWTNDMNQASYWNIRFANDSRTVSCTKYEGDSGLIGAQYDAAVTKKGDNVVRVYSDLTSTGEFQGTHPQGDPSEPGYTMSWVMKCTFTPLTPPPDGPLISELGLSYDTECAPDDTNSWRVRPVDVRQKVKWELFQDAVFIDSGSFEPGDTAKTINVPRKQPSTAILKYDSNGDDEIDAQTDQVASANDQQCQPLVPEKPTDSFTTRVDNGTCTGPGDETATMTTYRRDFTWRLDGNAWVKVEGAESLVSRSDRQLTAAEQQKCRPAKQDQASEWSGVIQCGVTTVEESRNVDTFSYEYVAGKWVETKNSTNESRTRNLVAAEQTDCPVAGESGTIPPSTEAPTTTETPKTTTEAPTTTKPPVAGAGGTVPPSTPAATLPKTGGSGSSGILQVGALLLLAGTAVFLAARRRNPEPAA